MRRPRLTLLIAILVGAIAGIVGAPVVGKMSNGIVDPSAESARALSVAAEASGRSADDDVLVLVDLPAGPTVDPARGTGGVGAAGGVDGGAGTEQGRARVAEVAAKLAAVPGVAEVVTSATSGNPALDATDRRSSLIIGRFRADVADPEDVARRVRAAFRGDHGITLGGTQMIGATITDTIGADLASAELLAFPVLLVLSIIIFRGLVAAVVPVALGGLSVVVGLLVLRGVVEVVDLTRFVMNLLIGLGIGLSIDYSLLIVSRYREEVARLGYGRPAVARAMGRAGRTIVFSAATVAAAMSTLTLFPQLFLRSMGIGGVVVTVVAALVALTVLPGVLVLLGPWIDRIAPARWQRRDRRPVSAGAWYRLARWQMRRPAAVLALVLAAITLVALPTARASFQNVDATALPATSAPRVLEDRLATEYALARGFVVTTVLAGPGDEARVAELAGRARSVPGYLPMGPPRYLGHGTWLIEGGTRTEAYAAASLRTVRALRALPTDRTVLVGGQSAAFVDLRSSIASRLPLALVIVSTVVLFAIFLLTGSVLVPVKTLAINVMNVLATLGVLVWIFQFGHLETLLRFTSSGRIDLLQPVLVLIIAFGLSTDYGVFLLARIKEHHDRTGDNTEAIAVGLGRTGTVISNAALLLCVAIGAFSTSNLVFVKVLGVGAVVAVALDATVVRAFLVPATMRLLGNANWWAPGWLRRAHRRIAVDETTGDPDSVPM